MLSRFHLIRERHGRTDGQTDRFAISIVIVLTRDNSQFELLVALLKFTSKYFGTESFLVVRLTITTYCRAMLSIAGTMLWQDLRPIETAKLIITLFSTSGRHTILVFPHQTVW